MTDETRQITEPVTITDSVLVLITANEWYTFARMAIRQEHRASYARNEGDRAENYASWLGLESDDAKLGLIAVKASVHHLQLILKDLLGLDNANKVRVQQITTDLPEDPAAWQRQFTDLADDRNILLHEKPKSSPGVKHPHYATLVSEQTAAPDLGRLSSAIDAMLDLLARVLESPTPVVEGWATETGRGDVVTRLRTFRQDSTFSM